jgi:hypothetical protein
VHLYDPYGFIREERQRRHRRAVIKFAAAWIVGLSTLVIVLNQILNHFNR